MSASDKKKIRKQQATAALTERQRQEQAEAKKLKAYSIAFIAGLVLIVVIVAAVLGVRAFTQSGIAEKSTIVATIGDHKLNTVEFNYYYNDTINDFYSSYSQYEQYGQSAADYIMALEGMDVSLPLSEQIKDKETGETWADYFVKTALERAKSDYVLSDMAKSEGFQLPEEDKENIETTITSIGTYATLYGFSNANQYLRAMYGNGSNTKTYKAYAERKSIADAYKQAHEDSLTYTAEQIGEYEKDKTSDYNSYTYSYAYLSYTDFRYGGTKDGNGNTTYSDAENNAAREAAKFAAETLATAKDLDELKEMIHMFENEETDEDHEHEDADAVEATEAEDATEATETTEAPTADETTSSADSAELSEIVKINGSSQLAVNDFNNVLHTEINAVLSAWLAEADRKEGDIAAIPNTTTTTADDGTETSVTNGYYVVCFKSMTDNKEPLGNVRHLLVKFEGGTENEETGEMEYTEEEKAAAKTEADEYLKTWKEGAKTEESFIELVKAHSDDTSASEGGLFEDIHPNSSYVANFRNWATDPARQTGDADVIETEYGYHVMYYVGDDELTYRDYMITNEMRADDQETWYNGLLDAVATEVKDTSRLNLDMILAAS